MTVRELQGWAPRTVTVDAAGSVVSVAVQEPRFTREEVFLLLASRRAERVPRGSHGHTLQEATDPNLQYEWRVPLPTTDFAQSALKKAQDAYIRRREAGEILPDPDSLLWIVERSKGSEAAPS